MTAPGSFKWSGSRKVRATERGDVTDERRLKRYGKLMQHTILDGVLGQKKISHFSSTVKDIIRTVSTN